MMFTSVNTITDIQLLKEERNKAQHQIDQLYPKHINQARNIMIYRASIERRIEEVLEPEQKQIETCVVCGKRKCRWEMVQLGDPFHPLPKWKCEAC